MEYCPNGDLLDFLKHTSKGALPAKIAKSIFHQIIDAVQFLHHQGQVAHLDLKPDNILLTDDFHVKLCDLGFSQSIHNRLYKGFGTDGYKAPEIYKISNPHLHDHSEIDMNDMSSVA